MNVQWNCFERLMNAIYVEKYRYLYKEQKLKIFLIISKEIKQVLQIDLNANGEFIRVVGATQIDHSPINKSQ